MSLSDRELDRRLGRLTGHWTPAPDTWRRIRARIAGDHRRSMGLRAAIWLGAAAALAGVALLRPNPAAEPGIVTLAIESQALLRDEHDATHGLPVMPEVLEPGWHAHREAVAEIRSALRAHGPDPVLLDLLAEARFRETRLLMLASLDPAVGAFATEENTP